MPKASPKQSRAPVDFERLFGDMIQRKAIQDAVVSYYELLDGVTAMTMVPADGSRLRDNISEKMRVLYDGGSYKAVWDAFSNTAPKDPTHKKPIPAVPLPIGDHYITSLKQSIGHNVPRPELRMVDGAVSADAETTANDNNLHRIGVLLQRMLVRLLKNGSDHITSRLLDRLQEEGMAKGLAGIRISKWIHTPNAPPELVIDLVPYDSLLLSESGRYLGVKLQVFKGSPNASEFRFEKNPWNEAEESDEASRCYWELYDCNLRRTYFINDGDGYERVKKTEPWPVGLDDPPVVLFMTGRTLQGSIYPSGLVERWLPIWEEIVIANSMLSYYSKRSSTSKLLSSLSITDDDEVIEAVEDPSRNFATIPQLGMAGIDGSTFDISKHLMPYKPVDSIAEWQNWLAQLRQMLAEYQYFPDISKGVQDKTSSYMKAGTAATINQTRERLVGEVSLAFGNMLERLYKHMLDFIGANPDISSVREFLKDEAAVAFLRRDMDISVSITDIIATPEQQDMQKMTTLLQGAPAIVQTAQALGMLYQGMGMQLDMLTLTNDIFEKAFGLPLKRYAVPMPDEMQGMSQDPSASPASAVAGPPTASGGSATDWLFSMLYERGMEDLTDRLGEIDPELVEAVAGAIQALFASRDQRAINGALSDLSDSLDASDPVGEIQALLRRLGG